MKVPTSEQFHVACGVNSTSLINKFPALAGGCTGVMPVTGGGIGDAHGCVDAKEVNGMVTLKKKSTKPAITRILTLPPILFL